MQDLLEGAPPAAVAPVTQAAQLTPVQSAEALSRAEPDLVTAIFDVLIESHPLLAQVREDGEHAVRHRLKGLRGTVTDRPDSDTMARRVLELFNGRNPREVARRLRISRGTVYRLLKQAGQI